jgi:hypothetical protein
MYIDDDLPKEGELLDITKKKSISTNQAAPSISTSTTPIKMTIGLIAALVVVAIVAFSSKMLFSPSASSEEAAVYQQGVQSIISTMKSQYPYLVSVTCDNEDPIKPDCTSFIASFVPVKDNQTYLSSMDTIDKVPGVSDADMTSIKGHIKTFIDNKRTSLPSARKPLRFLIESTTIPKVGEPYKIKTLCIEGTGDAISCNPVQ